jgi:diacylglycerol kinase
VVHLSDLVPYASVFAVFVAIVFGTLTLRQWQRTRYLAAAAELVHTIQNEQFNNAIARIVELPTDAAADLVRADKDLVAAAYVVGHVFESLGVLVFHDVLNLHLVDHLVGGYVRASWHRLGPYIRARRADLGSTFGEWFQWLAERIDEHPAPGKGDGAHVAFRHWKP